MGGTNVKITILQRVLQSIAPDLCYSCGKVGASFCQYCKYDIVSETRGICFRCSALSESGVCMKHRGYVERVSVVGWYENGLKHALKGLKFHNDKVVADTLGLLLAEAIPALPSDTVVIPVPTLRKNIRRRGYDQAVVLARAVATHKGLYMVRAVRRRTRFIQHKTNARGAREQQVKGAFTVSLNAPLPQRVVLVDDIITTGATVNEIARTLRGAGVKYVYVAAIAKA